jgi:hypothetical protein
MTDFVPDHCIVTKPPCSATADWFEEWFDLGDEESKRTFQPSQVAMKVLVEHGDRNGSDEVGISGRNRELSQAVSSRDWPHALYLIVSKYLTAYGFKPEISVGAIAFFTALGAIIFTRTPECAKWRMRWGIAFSFDMLLPIIRLREMHYRIDIRGPARYYFYLHRLVGWALGTFLVASLVGWIK